MATTAGVWGWTLAGVWARLGLVLVPGGVFFPVGVLEAAAGTKGDRGRLLVAAGDGGLFLGLVLLRRRQEIFPRWWKVPGPNRANGRSETPLGPRVLASTCSPVWTSVPWQWATLSASLSGPCLSSKRFSLSHSLCPCPSSLSSSSPPSKKT